MATDSIFFKSDERRAPVPGHRFRWALLLPLGVAAGAVCLWALLSSLNIFSQAAFPSPQAVAKGFIEDIRTGQIFNDIIASLFRVGIGFCLAALFGVPIGLWLGLHPQVRQTFLPSVNFFRSLSPLAWIPFAILWFGVGDMPAIFLIFTSTFFPLVLGTVAAVASIPAVYFLVAGEYGYKGWKLLTHVTLPAIMPQVIISLRVAGGVAWLVVVAAEMIAGRDGLGFSIWDARNGLRTDLLVCRMIVIGLIGVGLDFLLLRLTRMPRVRWGYEQ